MGLRLRAGHELRHGFVAGDADFVDAALGVLARDLGRHPGVAERHGPRAVLHLGPGHRRPDAETLLAHRRLGAMRCGHEHTGLAEQGSQTHRAEAHAAPGQKPAPCEESVV